MAQKASKGEDTVGSKASRKRVIDDEDDVDDAKKNACGLDSQHETAGKENKVALTVAEPAEKAATSSGSKETPTSAPTDTTDATLPSSVADIITWNAGESVPYMAVVETFERIAAVSGRLEKESLMSRLFRAVILTTPSDLEVILYLASNEVSPAYEGLELGIGDALLVKAVCEATGRKKDAVEEDYKREGDLGTVALASRASQKMLSFAAKPKPLLASYVLEKFREITKTKGEKAQGKKVDIIKGLMTKCQGTEAKYIVRALQGKLRIGTAAQTVLVALAQAFARSPPPAVQQLIKAHVLEECEEAGSLFKRQTAADDGDGGEDDILEDAEGEERGEDERKATSTAGGDGSGTKAVDTMEAEEMSLAEQISKIAIREPAEARKLRLGMAGRHWDKPRIGKEARDELAVIAVKRAFSECPSLSVLAKALLTTPIYELYLACRLVPGVPVAPMLAKPTKQIGEVLRRLSGLAFTMEFKYDGERAQVHLLPDGSVKIFSRNSEDNTEKYPDLMDVIRRARNEGVESCVLDAEVVAYDRDRHCLLPFQVLSTRKRKVEEGQEDNQTVKVVLEGFDLLYLNSKSLLQESLRTRRRLLHAAFRHEEGFFHFASGADHVEDGDTAPIEAFMTEACGAMCEGLMVKTLDDNASYEPSKRSLNWLKLKKDYIEGMGVCDSVDLVVLGGYHGKGKRTNVYGAYLMACYDPDTGDFQSVCKVGTGFKDEDLVRLTEKMRPLIMGTGKRPCNYLAGDALEPDDWFEASVVWELQAADLSKSSVHKGAIGRIDPQRGIGLRFPRFLRERDDKKAEQATTSEQIADMYRSQGEEYDRDAGKGEDEDDDFDGI